MKAAVTNIETVHLNKIEKMTSQILDKINSIRPSLFASNLKFSKKAEEQKKQLFKELIPKKMFSIDKTLDLLGKILNDANFSKLDDKDQRFIRGLEKIDLKNSQYITEINEFVLQGNDLDVIFSSLMEETLYFNYLNSELYDIDFKLSSIRLQP
ncbi:hypothetical protein [Flavobacterium sp. KACC 22761]|uniref:hypothetical protein n=1 Tax=Flavobacterium sp. KACC 22761 TaxID=3092665 RepID=UPI002A748B22|nr:hypothetical protein [Flavobacterium sp. KACC 22761]WPO77926.1 hypothetical protein SCB73_16785 [Flavobacterium sp. KACC 22761]